MSASWFCVMFFKCMENGLLSSSSQSSVRITKWFPNDCAEPSEK